MGQDQEEAVRATRLLNARVEESRATAKAEKIAHRALGPQDTALAVYLDRHQERWVDAEAGLTV